MKLPESVAETDVARTDPSQQDVAVPLGVAGGDRGFSAGVTLKQYLGSTFPYLTSDRLEGKGYLDFSLAFSFYSY